MVKTETPMTTAPDGRHVHIWHDNNIDELTAAIASNIELYNFNEALAVLDDSKLVPISLTGFHGLITKHICTVKITANGKGGYKKEFVPFAFPHIPHPGAPTAATGPM